jgi:thiamine pyrophosphokinase
VPKRLLNQITLAGFNSRKDIFVAMNDAPQAVAANRAAPHAYRLELSSDFTSGDFLMAGYCANKKFQEKHKVRLSTSLPIIH